jgi:hypothetical protein
MQPLRLAGLLLVYLLIVPGGGAQRLSEINKPMWEIESLKVKPGMFGFTLGYLDDNWMRARAEAKRQGLVLSYHRLVEQNVSGNGGNIVLVTEYKDSSTYYLRGALFAEIAKRLPNIASGVMRPSEPRDLFENVGSAAFLDCPETENVQPRLLSKN